MINQVVLVGRTTSEAKVTLDNKEIKHAQVSIAVQRNFKSPNGKTDVDFIPLNIWYYNVDVIKKVHKGSLIGITGTIANMQRTSKVGNTYYALEVSVDKLTIIRYHDLDKNEDNVAEMPENNGSAINLTENCEDIDLQDQDVDYALS